MKRLLIPALAAAALTAAVTPALAQSYGGDYRQGAYGNDYRRGDAGNINGRERELRMRIEAGVRDGSLTRSEAWQLQRELRGIEALEQRYRNDGYRYGRNGLDARERSDLDRRLDSLSQRVYRNRHDDDRRNWDRRYR
jgi:hypothetical protein